jgi:uncharacterized membrane protein
MDFQTTLIIVLAAVTVFAASLYLARKAEPLTKLSYVPWTAIQFISLLMIIVFGAHLYSEWRGVPLMGTRNPLRGL